ncbi:MAG: polar amino acid transport system substrate-binding protein [Gammaproteobacteria bacterium]|jgi:polar amino acid transport system substrate-binding protein
MLKMPILIFGLLMFTSSMLIAEPLRFAQITNSPDQIVGAAVLKVIYAKAGVPIEIIPLSGKRALLESSQGRLDGEVHRILEIGSIYPSLIKVPTATNYIKQTIFSKNKEGIVDGCESLRGKLVGRARGVRHAEICTQGIDNVAVFPDSNSLMKSLDRDIVDYAITSNLNGLVQLEKLGISSVIALKPTLGKRLLFHYLHKKHEYLIPELESIISAMTKSGELDLIRQQQIQNILAHTHK